MFFDFLLADPPCQSETVLIAIPFHFKGLEKHERQMLSFAADQMNHATRKSQIDIPFTLFSQFLHENLSHTERERRPTTSNKPNEENKKARNEEKQRFMRYLNDHNMSSRKLTCKKNDTLNDVVTCFVIKWQDEGLTAESPSGGAIFRFLTDECNLQSDKCHKFIDFYTK